MYVGEAAEVVAAVGAFHYVAEDFARGGGEGVQLRHRAIGEVDADKAFVDTLTRPVVVHPVVEHQYDGGDAEAVLAAHGGEVGDAAQGPFHSDGDLLLDFLGGEARHLGDHLDGGV